MIATAGRGRRATACAAALALATTLAVAAPPVAAAPASGQAAAGAVVAVVVIDGAGPEDRAAVTAAVAAALAPGRVVVDDVLARARAAVDAGAVPVDALDGFARVAELADEGWRAYLQVATDFAVARLGEARRQAEALLPLDGGLEVYADAALRLGAALDNAGRRGEADDVLRLAARLDPDRAVTRAEFSPDVVEAFARATAATPPRRAVRLEVAAAGGGAAAVPGATLEVDGVPVGAAPAEVDLEAGQHVVVARAPGHAAHGETVAIAVGGAAPVATITLDPDPVAAGLAIGPETGQSAPAAAAWLEGAMRYGEVDAVVLAASIWRSGRPALLVQWCDGAPVSCTAPVEVGYDDGGLAAAARAAADELAGAADGARYGATLPADPRVATGGGRRPGGGGARCRWCRPALWIGGGVAAVAIAVTAAVLVAGGGDRGTSIAVDPGDWF